MVAWAMGTCLRTAPTEAIAKFAAVDIPHVVNQKRLRK